MAQSPCRNVGRLLTVRSQATAQQKQTAVCLIETTPLVFALKRFLVERVSFLFRCEQKPELTPVFANTSLLSVRR